MAERRVQMRQGRRERRRDGDEQARNEIKRRSRSEGPSGRRVAQSMDVGSGNNKKTGQSNSSFEKRNNVSRNSPPGSDDGGFVNPDPSGSDSDSESDRMQWTKNPLLVRRMKKNKSEKRNSSAENSAANSGGYNQMGARNTNRESWVYLAPEGVPVPGMQEQQRQQQQKSEGGSNSGSLKNKYQKLEEMRKKRIDIAVTSDEENTPESRISRLRQRALQGGLANQPKGDNSRAIVSDHNGQSLVRPFNDRGSSEVAGRQQFYTIPEPQTGHRAHHNSSPEFHVRRFNPAVRVPSADSIYDDVNFSQDSYGPSRFAPANRSSVAGQRAFAQVNPPTRDVMEVQRGTTVQYSSPVNRRQPPSQFNEVVELRLKSSKVIDRPLSGSFRSPVVSEKKQEGVFHSDDSLDELIESNIQYLEREISQGSSAKKSSAPVSRSSSLPDPRRVTARGMNKDTTVSGQRNVQPTVQATGQQAVRPTGQVSAQPQNKSEIHFRVPLPGPSHTPATPQIHIAEENQWSDSAYPGPNTSYTFGNVPRVERKHSYDRTRTSRPNSEYIERDDLSKSDTQLNAAVVPPTYRGSMLHPNYAAGRGCVSDQNLTVGSPADHGMFSDVEYDIEVSERVKKWETFMKKDTSSGGEGKLPVTLTPIEERYEADNLMMPSEVRKSLRMSQHGNVNQSPTVSTSHPQTSLLSLKPASSDPTLHLGGDAKVLSRETNLHRFFQVVQDPTGGFQMGPQLSHSTSSVYIELPKQAPQMYTQSSVLYQPGGIMSPNELRQHMLANQRSRAEAARAAQSQPALPASDPPDGLPENLKRASRYQDEIEEMSSVKHQSVQNLRRRFDEGKGTTSDDESRSDARVAKVSPTHKDGSDIDWTQMISGLENKIRDMEVWSPNMESTQGNVVSIERVKARTLQTIPFSEDPFWKEIEEMTSFDPNSLGGHLALLGQPEDRSIMTQSAEPMTSHTSSSLTSQPRPNPAMSMRERLQKSKSLYTPNITPLTINVDPYAGGKSSSLERGASTDKYSGPSALDDVLEDIRSSLERKPLSPKRKTGDSSDSHRSSPGPTWTSELMKSRTERSRGAAGSDGPPVSSWDNASTFTGQVNQPMSITISSTQKPQVAGGGMTAGHYHLDPNLLKQKLLSTGLVEEEQHRFEEAARDRMSSLASSSASMSKPVAVAPPQTVIRSVVAPTQRPTATTRPSQQQDKLSQVNDSMEELRQLAVNVERKIGLIKSRLLTADDQNLDKILLSLRKFAPSAGPKSPEIRPSSMQDFYHSKKSKLEDALTELERIYTSLDLNNEMLMDRAERRDYPMYRTKSTAPSVNVTTTASISPSSANPARTKSSSVYITPMTKTSAQAETSPYQQRKALSKVETDQQMQSEFDLISKSFQAIIDEVNKTASLVSSASTSSQPRTHHPLPEIKELQIKAYASREQDLQKQVGNGQEPEGKG
nr:hypothetical protein BaRGS_032697 [Batillaria attramentaria]